MELSNFPSFVPPQSFSTYISQSIALTLIPKLSHAQVALLCRASNRLRGDTIARATALTAAAIESRVDNVDDVNADAYVPRYIQSSNNPFSQYLSQHV